MKKIILLLGILVVIGVALFLGLTSSPEGEGETRVGFSLREFLPFGRSDEDEVSEPIDNDNIGEIPTTNIDAPVPKLRKISNEPVAGAVIFNTGSTSVVRFVEKGTGNVYEVKSDSNQKVRLTNTTIPKTVRAFWLRDGSGFLAQTILSESGIIETNLVKLQKVASSSLEENLTPYDTVISRLPTDIKEIAIKPDGSKIFYYTISNGNSRWYSSNPDGTGSILLYSHPLTEWFPKWTFGETIYIQTKPSSQSIGYAYSFDTKTKILKKITGGIYGISFNPDSRGEYGLISNGGTAPDLLTYSYKENLYTRTNVKSISDKCVWLNKQTLTAYCAVPNELRGANYPDSWYKGTVTTEDSIKKVVLNDAVFYNSVNLSQEGGERMDVIDPSISSDDTHMIFRNKIDGFLWMLRLEE